MSMPKSIESPRNGAEACQEFDAALQHAVNVRAPLGRAASVRAESVASASAFPGGYAEHLAVCERCSAGLREAAALQAAFSAWARRLPEVDLTDAVLARLAREASPPASAPRCGSPPAPVVELTIAPRVARDTPSPDVARRAVLGIVAAALLLAVFLFGVSGRPASDRLAEASRPPVHNLPGVKPPPGDAMVDSEKSRDQPDRSAVGEDVEIAGLLKDAGAASLSLAEEAVGVVREAASLVAMTGRSATEPPPPSIKYEGTASPSDGLAPWTKKLENAVDFLWDALPLSEGPAT